MKITALAAALLAAGASAIAAQPALAEDKMEAEAAPVALSIDSTIEALMANEAAAAILEKHFPGIGAHPAYDQFKGMSLVQLQPWSQGMITEDSIAAVKADLEAMGEDA